MIREELIIDFITFFATYTYPFILSILSAIFGAWLSVKWGVWYNDYRYSKQADLLGDWLSSWDNPENQEEWLSERVHIDVKKGMFVLKNTEN